jgi:hypothetical protein
MIRTCAPHKMHFNGPTLQPGVFKAQGGGMSVDWEKYSSPNDTRQRGRIPADNAVIALPVSGIRDIDDLDVIHTPTTENQAHSDVFGIPDPGEELTEIRTLLLKLADIVIHL